jgi:hypothetical protein
MNANAQLALEGNYLALPYSLALLLHVWEIQWEPHVMFASRTRFFNFRLRNFLNEVYVTFKQKIKLHCSFQMPMEPPIWDLKLSIFRRSTVSVAFWHKMGVLMGTFSERIC